MIEEDEEREEVRKMRDKLGKRGEGDVGRVSTTVKEEVRQ